MRKRQAYWVNWLKTLAAGAIAFGAATALDTPVRAQGTASFDKLEFTGTSGELWRSARDAFKGKKIVYVPIVTGYALFDGWTYVIKREAAALGMELTVQDANWSPDVMTQAISAAIANKVDVIIAHNPDVKVLAKLLKQAQDAGIFVVQINMVSNQKTDAFVGGDWLTLGAIAAQDLVKECSPSKGKSGKIAIVQGATTAAATYDQYNGVKEVLKAHPEIKIVSDQSTGPLWSSDNAKANISAVLQQHPDLCATFGFWDYMDLGTVAAVKEAGKQGQVLVYSSGGGSQQMCDLVKDGGFTKYWMYNSVRQGQDIMAAVRMLLMSGQKPGAMKLALFSPNELVTKETLRPNTCFSEAMVAQK